jgi:hypothetical protein
VDQQTQLTTTDAGRIVVPDTSALMEGILFTEYDWHALDGYSAPATDLTVTTLIATPFKGKTIVPVNPDTDIIRRAKELGDRRNMPTVDKSFVFPLSPNDPSPLEKLVNTFGS